MYRVLTSTPPWAGILPGQSLLSVHTSTDIIAKRDEMQGFGLYWPLVQIISDGHHIGDDAGCTRMIPGTQDIYQETARTRMHMEIHLPSVYSRGR